MITKKRIVLSLIAVTLLCAAFLAFANSSPGIASSAQPVSPPERTGNHDFGSLLLSPPLPPVHEDPPEQEASAGFVEVQNGHFFLWLLS